MGSRQVNIPRGDTVLTTAPLYTTGLSTTGNILGQPRVPSASETVECLSFVFQSLFHRHPYICILFNSRFISYNQNKYNRMILRPHWGYMSPGTLTNLNLWYPQNEETPCTMSLFNICDLDVIQSQPPHNIPPPWKIHGGVREILLPDVQQTQNTGGLDVEYCRLANRCGDPVVVNKGRCETLDDGTGPPKLTTPERLRVSNLPTTTDFCNVSVYTVCLSELHQPRWRKSTPRVGLLCPQQCRLGQSPTTSGSDTASPVDKFNRYHGTEERGVHLHTCPVDEGTMITELIVLDKNYVTSTTPHRNLLVILFLFSPL